MFKHSLYCIVNYSIKNEKINLSSLIKTDTFLRVVFHSFLAFKSGIFIVKFENIEISSNTTLSIKVCIIP